MKNHNSRAKEFDFKIHHYAQYNSHDLTWPRSRNFLNNTKRLKTHKTQKFERTPLYSSENACYSFEKSTILSIFGERDPFIENDIPNHDDILIRKHSKKRRILESLIQILLLYSLKDPIAAYIDTTKHGTRIYIARDSTLTNLDVYTSIENLVNNAPIENPEIFACKSKNFPINEYINFELKYYRHIQSFNSLALKACLEEFQKITSTQNIFNDTLPQKFLNEIYGTNLENTLLRCVVYDYINYPLSISERIALLHSSSKKGDSYIISLASSMSQNDLLNEGNIHPTQNEERLIALCVSCRQVISNILALLYDNPIEAIISDSALLRRVCFNCYHLSHSKIFKSFLDHPYIIKKFDVTDRIYFLRAITFLGQYHLAIIRFISLLSRKQVLFPLKIVDISHLAGDAYKDACLRLAPSKPSEYNKASNHHTFSNKKSESFCNSWIDWQEIVASVSPHITIPKDKAMLLNLSYNKRVVTEKSIHPEKFLIDILSVMGKSPGLIGTSLSSCACCVKYVSAINNFLRIDAIYKSRLKNSSHSVTSSFPLSNKFVLNSDRSLYNPWLLTKISSKYSGLVPGLNPEANYTVDKSVDKAFSDCVFYPFMNQNGN